MCYNLTWSRQSSICFAYGWIPEWPKGADCKSVGDAFEGSNPSPSIKISRIKPKRIEFFSIHFNYKSIREVDML